jgi:D-tyrosyl-tRNA(Tyr) deacylase
MRVVVQRVASARVEVDGQVTGSIGAGLLVLAGFEPSTPTPTSTGWPPSCPGCASLPTPAGVMNRSVVDADGEVLAVSQFTLFASTRKGNRPSWSRAAPPELAQPLFERFVLRLEKTLRTPVPTGVFGADMQFT